MIYQNRNKGGAFIKWVFVIAVMAVVVYFCGPIVMDKIDTNRAEHDEAEVNKLVDFVVEAMEKKYYITSEFAKYAAHGNVSCYIDKKSENSAQGIIVTQSATDYKEQKMFKDNNRVEKNTPFYAAGNMYGLTMTFELDEEHRINFDDVIINKYVEPGQNGSNLSTRLLAKDRDCDLKTYENAVPNYKKYGTLSTMSASGQAVSREMYKLFTKQFDDPITMTSNKYKDSEFTIFISFQINEANEISPKTTKVYGQWNGYYLGVQNESGSETKPAENEKK